MKRFVFDLDNTLIYTDFLNNESYNYALLQSGFNSINNCTRITRMTVRKRHPYIDCVRLNEIIQIKQDYFTHNLFKTIPNEPVINLLKQQNPQDCLLWTSASEARVYSLMKYYDISKSFKDVLMTSKKTITSASSRRTNEYRRDLRSRLW